MTLAPAIYGEDGGESGSKPKLDLSHVQVGQRYIWRDSGTAKFGGPLTVREVVEKTDVTVRYYRYLVDSEHRQISDKLEFTWTVDSIDMPAQPWGEVETITIVDGTEFQVVTHILESGETIKLTVSGGVPTFPGTVYYLGDAAAARRDCSAPFFDRLAYVEEP